MVKLAVHIDYVAVYVVILHGRHRLFGTKQKSHHQICVGHGGQVVSILVCRIVCMPVIVKD
jgi:hypothetical protein